MQVLEIRSANEHRILTKSDADRPPPGLAPWPEAMRPHMPFAQVWADPELPAAVVAEIINGYAPPP